MAKRQRVGFMSGRKRSDKSTPQKYRGERDGFKSFRRAIERGGGRK